MGEALVSVSSRFFNALLVIFTVFWFFGFMIEIRGKFCEGVKMQRFVKTLYLAFNN